MDGETWGDEKIFTYVKSLWLEYMNKTYRGSGQNPSIDGRVDHEVPLKSEQQMQLMVTKGGRVESLHPGEATYPPFRRWSYMNVHTGSSKQS